MRVLHLGKFFPPVRGGIENFLYDLADAQAMMGLEPFVLAHHEGPSKSTVFERSGRVQVCRASILANLLYAPISPQYPFILKSILKRFDPHIIHTHLPNSSVFWLLLLARRRPIVIHWHADVVASQIDRRLAHAYRFYRLLERRLLELASVVVATSKSYLRSSAPLKEFMSKSCVIPLGLDPDRLYSPSAEDIADLKARWPGKYLLASAGRFAYYKGYDVLIEAVKDLPDVSLVIAGTGRLREAIAQRVNVPGLSGRVHLPGEIDNRGLHTLMAACDLFCLPSIERTEAFGLTLLEAMAFAKPLISTAIEGSGTGWVNKHGKTGLVVEPGNPEALKSAISSLMADPHRRTQMGLAAGKRLHDKFHIKRIAEQVQTVYSSICH